MKITDWTHAKSSWVLDCFGHTQPLCVRHMSIQPIHHLKCSCDSARMPGSEQGMHLPSPKYSSESTQTPIRCDHGAVCFMLQHFDRQNRTLTGPGTQELTCYGRSRVMSHPGFTLQRQSVFVCLMSCSSSGTVFDTHPLLPVALPQFSVRQQGSAPG